MGRCRVTETAGRDRPGAGMPAPHATQAGRPPPPPVLEVRDLAVEFRTRRGSLKAVDGVDCRIGPGRCLGIVGESGCGKSVTALAIMGLVDPPGRVVGGSIDFRGEDLRALDEDALLRLRGAELAMIFQEPTTSLNPVMTVGDQVAEVLVLHDGLAARVAMERAIELLRRVGIPTPERRARDYPHQLSGGMRQRVMIAMALACRPALLIADEPTTALDVTVQAQILELILDLQESDGMAVLFISHDLGVISEIADEVAVMYAGSIVEQAPSEVLLAEPRHPYTRGLLATLPRLEENELRLPTIPGAVPDLGGLPRGCAFQDRCPDTGADCRAARPVLEVVAPDHRVACHRVGAG